MRARTLNIIITFLLLLLIVPLSRADNTIVAPDMGWGGGDTIRGDEDPDSLTASIHAVLAPTTQQTTSPWPSAQQTTSPRTLDSAYYDLQGRKVTAPIKGHIYIHQGNKVIIK